jgi:hypothetical protein
VRPVKTLLDLGVEVVGGEISIGAVIVVVCRELGEKEAIADSELFMAIGPYPDNVHTTPTSWRRYRCVLEQMNVI